MLRAFVQQALSKVVRFVRRMAVERAAEVPEYVIVVAIIAMLSVAGLVTVKSGLVSNLTNIGACLTGTAAGSSSSCT